MHMSSRRSKSSYKRSYIFLSSALQPYPTIPRFVADERLVDDELDELFAANTKIRVYVMSFASLKLCVTARLVVREDAYRVEQSDLPVLLALGDHRLLASCAKDVLNEPVRSVVQHVCTLPFASRRLVDGRTRHSIGKNVLNAQLQEA